MTTICLSPAQATASSDHNDFDVSGAVVQPVFRSTPWDEEARDAAAGGRGTVRVLFVSESNVCRSVLAEATMRDLLEAHGMQDVVTCESRASKDYNTGDAPDPALQHVAAELELRWGLLCFSDQGLCHPGAQLQDALETWRVGMHQSQWQPPPSVGCPLPC